MGPLSKSLREPFRYWIIGWLPYEQNWQLKVKTNVSVRILSWTNSPSWSGSTFDFNSWYVPSQWPLVFLLHQWETFKLKTWNRNLSETLNNRDESFLFFPSVFSLYHWFNDASGLSAAGQQALTVMCVCCWQGTCELCCTQAPIKSQWGDTSGHIVATQPLPSFADALLKQSEAGGGGDSEWRLGEGGLRGVVQSGLQMLK